MEPTPMSVSGSPKEALTPGLFAFLLRGVYNGKGCVYIPCRGYSWQKFGVKRIPHYAVEQELQRELDLPRGRGRLSDHACRWADRSARKNDLVRVREIGVIENVEPFARNCKVNSSPTVNFLNNDVSRSTRPGLCTIRGRRMRHPKTARSADFVSPYENTTLCLCSTSPAS